MYSRHLVILGCLIGVVATVSPASADLDPYCRTNNDECACINLENCGGITFIEARLNFWPETPRKQWICRAVPSGSGVRIRESITATVFANELQTSINSWQQASGLVPLDEVTVNPADPHYGVWDVQWLSADEIGSQGAGLADTRTDIFCGGAKAYIGNATMIYAYDPYTTDANNLRHDLWWHPFDTNYALSLIDIRVALSHEYGHTLGFAHHSEPSAVMNQNLPADAHARYITSVACEMAGVARLYSDASIDATVDWLRVEPHEGGVRIRWHVSVERAVSEYLIERAASRFDDYVLVGTMTPSGAGSYAYVDATHSVGFYRLRELTTLGDTLVHLADTLRTDVGAAPQPGPTEAEMAAMREQLELAYPTGTPEPPIEPTSAKWLCIVPDGWESYAWPLASFWTSRGHPAAVVTLSETGGTGGIKQYLYGLRNGPLRQVLLVGDANDDLYWSNGSLWVNGWTRPDWPPQPELNILPMGEYVVDTRPPSVGTHIGGWTPYWASDWTYVDFDADHLPDIDIGRAPVRTAQQLTLFVQKTINATVVPGCGGQLRDVGLWVYARDENFGDGDTAAEIGESLQLAIPANRTANVLIDTPQTAMTSMEREAAAKAAMEAGRSLLVVSGTAASQANWCQWWVQHEFTWPTRTAANWGVMPFLVGAACGIASTDLTEDPWPAGQSGGFPTAPMVEQALWDPTRGPWGCFGPSRAGQQRGHAALAKEFMKAVFVDNVATAGAAARQAMREVFTQTPQYADLSRSYVFLGDPLVPLRTTLPAVNVAINGDSLVSPQTTETWTAAPEGGDCAYAYQWRRRPSGSTNWGVVVGTGAEYESSIDQTDFWLRVTATSAGTSDSTEICVGNTAQTVDPIFTMTGPQSACIGESPTWSIGSVSGGRTCGQYDYAWRWRPIGGQWSGIVATSASYSRQVAAGGLEVMLTVNNSETSEKKVVTAWPCAVADLYSDVSSDTEIWLSWTAPAILGAPAVEYDLRYSSVPIDDTNFDTFPEVSAPTPGAPGWYENHPVSGLSPNTTYWFAIKGKNASGHWAPISNVLSASTFGGWGGGGGGGGYRAREVDVPSTAGRSGGLASIDVTKGGVQGPELQRSGGSLQSLGNSASLMSFVGPRLSGDGKQALAAEMRLEAGRPVWSVYYIDSVETAGMVGPDSTTIVLQRLADEGDWRSRLRVRPAQGSWRFALRGWRREGRAVFRGDFGLMQAWGAVGYQGSREREVLDVKAARHSRLGDVTAGVAAGQYDLGLAPGDTLKLTYGLTTDSTATGPDWFLLVGPSGASLELGSRRLPTSGELPPVPSMFALRQNQPNPFDRTTSIRFELPAETSVRLEIFDAQGRLVRTLADGAYPAGFHAVAWDHRTDSGQAMGAGVYLYRIQAGSFRDQKKMVLLAR